jgi:hypothetical protein
MRIYMRIYLKVGKKLFSYVVVLGTPVGDIVSNFAPYYGEVGTLNAGQAAFPPVLHKDVVQRKEALVSCKPHFLKKLASNKAGCFLVVHSICSRFPPPKNHTTYDMAKGSDHIAPKRDSHPSTIAIWRFG